jgi:hypothetical protein
MIKIPLLFRGLGTTRSLLKSLGLADLSGAESPFEPAKLETASPAWDARR